MRGPRHRAQQLVSSQFWRTADEFFPFYIKRYTVSIIQHRPFFPDMTIHSTPGNSLNHFGSSALFSTLSQHWFCFSCR